VIKTDKIQQRSQQQLRAELLAEPLERLQRPGIRDFGTDVYCHADLNMTQDARVGEVEFAPDLPIADPLECLAFVAASSTTILLGTGVLLLPFHHPVGLAKRLATIDVLCSGRMRLLTIGSAASRTRPPPSESITRPGAAAPAGEAIDVLCALWAGDATGTSFDGEFYSFENVTSHPKPLQMLPIHVGGSSAAAAHRAGRRGDGFFVGGRLTPAERLAQIELMHTTASNFCASVLDVKTSS
jgi:alkanesulfonate monooxygenase SsuD/methylene tetrahydromethanopterin reductase-like flavin-dependent oxidoreductase (luciferase family)